MANDVFANGREISCKAADGKSIAAFPDVCLSPPTPPAGPVPLPYPNTAYASDTAGGSKRVRISGKEVMLRDSSYFKKSTGDEAATQGLPKGFVTHALQGKAYFNSWSMDVKIEGQNAVRHLDLTTHNHMSKPGQTPTWPYLDSISVKPGDPCRDDIKKERSACKATEVKTKSGKLRVGATKRKRCGKSKEAKACRAAQRCMLQPHAPNRCCKGEQAHHLVEVHCFTPIGGREDGARLTGFSKYDAKKAPTVCAAGAREEKEHGALHAVQQALEAAFGQRDAALKSWGSGNESRWTYAEARDSGVLAHSLVYPDCNPQCIEKQLDAYHKQPSPGGPAVSDNTPIRTDPYADSRSKGIPSAQVQDAVDTAVAQGHQIAMVGF